MIQENNNLKSNFIINNSFYANTRALNDSNNSFGLMSPDLSAASSYSYGVGDSSGCYSTSTSPIIPATQHVQEQQLLQQQQLYYEQQVCNIQQQHLEQKRGTAQPNYSSEFDNLMSLYSNSSNNNNDNEKTNNGLTHVCADINDSSNNNNNNSESSFNIGQLLDNGFDYVPQAKTVVEPKICEISDASTVDDLNTDAEPPAPDENFTYLQGLNSDNLMQFSQQTVIQELMVKEHLERKPNLDTLPTFEQHDYGGYNFQFKIHKQCKSKLNWVYSDKLNKVYIRMNQVFNIDAVFKPKKPMQQLRLRAFLCFVKEVSEPVLRCQNHISKDTDSHVDLRPYLLRCENPYTEYCGTPEGRSINERYSVLVPLNMCVTPQDDKSIKQTIALKFTCQNSCIGRKETSIVFLLEGMNGEVLAQRILDVKICSCPKRDRDLDEASKRKMEDDICPRQAKVRKRSVSSMQSEFVKEEVSLDNEEFQHEDSDDDESIDFNVRTEPGPVGVRVVLDFSDKTYLTRVVDSIFSIFAEKWFPVPHSSKRLIRRANKIRKMRDRALKIRRQ